MSKFDLLIKGGTVVDGTGKERFSADVGIRDGQINEIAKDLGRDADQVIDASGLIVAPGGIDAHTHFDAQVHWDPYCTPHSWNGVTSSIITNCGFGYAPVRAEMRERTMAMMETTEQVPLSAQQAVLPWSWETFPEWLEHLRSIPKGMNVSSYLPMNQLLIYVMGIDDAKSRRATKEEMATLKEMLNQAMDAGAMGFALSHVGHTSSHTDFDGSPMPADVHDPADFYELARVLKARGEGVIQITANFPGTDNQAIAEELARASGRPVIHLVLGPYDSAPDYHREKLEWLSKCVEEGLQIYSQPGPPNARLEFSLEYLNTWERLAAFRPFVNASIEEKKRLCVDPEFLATAKESYDPVVLGGSGGRWEDWRLVRAHCDAYREHEGKQLSEVVNETDGEITALMFDLLAKSEIKAEFCMEGGSSTDPEKYREILSHPNCLPGLSDGGAHLRFIAMPWYVEYISWAVRDHNVISLEDFHYKASGQAAEVLGLEKRGKIKEGFAADLAIYDLEKLEVQFPYLVIDDVPGDFRRANPPPPGMRYVIVNGVPIFVDGESTGELPGMVHALGSNGSVQLHEEGWK